jgi:hypothetical protein
MWLQATHAWFCSIQGVVRVTYLEQDNVMTPSLWASEMPPRESCPMATEDWKIEM